MTGVVHPTDPSPPRDLTITKVFPHGIELNWIPPRETNGDIQHYIIKYTTQDGTEQEITTTDNTNYYNLTGLESGKRYEISIVAVNSFASEPSTPSLSYGHHSSKQKGCSGACGIVCTWVTPGKIVRRIFACMHK